MMRPENELVVAMTARGLERYIRRLKAIREKDDPYYRDWLIERMATAVMALEVRRKVEASPRFALDESYWGEASDRDDLAETETTTEGE